MTASERYPSIPDLPRMVPAKNANGEIQRIPSRWLDHPTLGRGFTLTPSFRAAMSSRAAAADDAATEPVETATGDDSTPAEGARVSAPTTAARTGETAPGDDAPASDPAATTAEPTTTRRKARTATKEA